MTVRLDLWSSSAATGAGSRSVYRLVYRFVDPSARSSRDLRQGVQVSMR